MPVDTRENKPDISVQVFLSLVKYFLYILVAVNIIWAGIFIHYVNKSFNGTSSSMEVWQDGTNNNNTQSMTNG